MKTPYIPLTYMMLLVGRPKPISRGAANPEQLAGNGQRGLVRYPFWVIPENTLTVCDIKAQQAFEDPGSERYPNNEPDLEKGFAFSGVPNMGCLHVWTLPASNNLFGVCGTIEFSSCTGTQYHNLTDLTFCTIHLGRSVQSLGGHAQPYTTPIQSYINSIQPYII